jgi:hypothetical protein
MDPIAIASVVASAVVAVAVIYRDVFRSWYSKPKFDVKFSSEEPVSRVTNVEWPPGLGQEKRAFWPRLRIVNTGRSVARRCEAILAEVRSPDGSFNKVYDPLALRWAIAPISGGLEPLDIARGRQVDLNTIILIEGERVAYFATHKDPTGFPLYFEPGDYWIRITIYGDNFEPVSRGYAIHWDGKDYRRVDMIEMNNPPTSLAEWPLERIR